MRLRSFATLLLAGSAITTMPAWAQTAPAGNDAGSNGIETVTVTAEKRSEAAQKVPISISVASADELKKQDVNDISDLQKIIPGFQMTFAGAEAQPTIRGVGTQVASPGLPSNVAIYQDGFYQPNAIANDLEFPDVKNVEVLKGPQGELYGQNATGGAVLVSTRDPEFTPQADLFASYRSFNDFRGGFFATTPITDTLAGSLSIYGRDSDGYNTNIVTGQKGLRTTTLGGRAKLLWQPTSRMSFELAVEHFDKNDPNVYIYGDYDGVSVGKLTPGTIVDNGQPYHYSYDGRPIFTDHLTDVSLKANFDLGWANLTSLSHSQWQHNNSAFDIDGSSAPISYTVFPGTDHNASQEFDLASEGDGPVQWLAGAFFFHDNGQDSFSVPVAGSLLQELQGGVVTNSIALFGDVTYNIWDKLYLTAGVRYSDDHLKENFGSPFLPPPPSGGEYGADKSFNAWTPRFVARYEFSDDANIYASYSEGYKSGGFNPNGLSLAPVEPEKISAYEVGYKQTSASWHMDAAAFYYDYTNLQVNDYLGSAVILLNAASARVYGSELSGGVTLADGLDLDGGLSWVHARYVEFADAPRYTWDPASGITVGSGNASNNPLPNSPDYSAKANLNYVHPLGTGSIELNGGVTYQSTVYFDPFEQLKQTGYALLGARATWIAPDDKYEVSLFSDNLTDKKYITQAFPEPTAFFQKWAPPLTVGVEVKTHIE